MDSMGQLGDERIRLPIAANIGAGTKTLNLGKTDDGAEEIQYALIHIDHAPLQTEGLGGSQVDTAEDDTGTDGSEEADTDIYGSEDAQTVVMPSINRAASYVATHRTTALEKSITFDINRRESRNRENPESASSHESSGGPVETAKITHLNQPPVRPHTHHQHSHHLQHAALTTQSRVDTGPHPRPDAAKLRRRHSHHHGLKFPSPWKAGPRTMTVARDPESKAALSGAGRTRRALSGGGETLKRFLPSIGKGKNGSFFPNLPNVPFFKEKGKQPTITGGPATAGGRSRAQSLSSKMSDTRGAGLTQHIAHQRSAYASERDLITDSTHLATEPEGSRSIGKPQLLRRVTSENGLYTSMSRVVIQGDDSRWANQREMVNSRVKAIMDSLQDRTSFKVPQLPKSLPSMPAFDMFGNKEKDAGLKRMSKNKSPNTSASNLPAEPEDELGIALKTLTGDVVIMGGYRGSILRSAHGSHRRFWVPVKVGLNIRKVNLEVGLTDNDEEEAEKEIFASGMLQNIGPVDISRRLIKRMQECDNAKAGLLRVHDYGYDWRLSPHLLARKLRGFLEKLPCNQPDANGKIEGATVIAHSLGGLITRYLVNALPELFKGCIYAGTPQACINILGPLRNGDEVLLSSKVLTAQVNFSLRTSFLLLPAHGRGFYDKETGEGIPLDFFDVRQWIKYRWSPCIDPPLPAYCRTHNTGVLQSLTSSMANLPVPGRKQSKSVTKLANGGCDRLPSHRSSAKSPEAHKENPPRNTQHKHSTNLPFSSYSSTPNLRTEAPKPNAADPAPLYSSSPEKSASTGNLSSGGGHLNPPIPRQVAIEYLSRILPQIKSFKEHLRHREDHEEANRYPPFAVLYGHSCATVASVKVRGSNDDQYESSIAATDVYDDLGFGDGDGVVLVREAMMAEGYRIVKGGIIGSERGHLGLCGDLDAMGKLLNAIQRGRGRGMGLGPTQGEKNTVEGQQQGTEQMQEIKQSDSANLEVEVEGVGKKRMGVQV